MRWPLAAIGHIALGLSAGRLHPGGLTWRTAIAYSTVSLMPDLDVLAFAFHIPYSAPFGHRGATHSFAFAALCGVAMLALTRAWLPAVLVALTVASHPLLDSLTDGGLGVAFFWPVSEARHFAPWTPLPVAPIGKGMLSSRGLYVVLVEAAAFLPFWLFALWPRRARAAAATG